MGIWQRLFGKQPDFAGLVVPPDRQTVCSKCGSTFAWARALWREGSVPDCPACRFNNNSGLTGQGEPPTPGAYKGTS